MQRTSIGKLWKKKYTYSRFTISLSLVFYHSTLVQEIARACALWQNEEKHVAVALAQLFSCGQLEYIAHASVIMNASVMSMAARGWRTYHTKIYNIWIANVPCRDHMFTQSTVVICGYDQPWHNSNHFVFGGSCWHIVAWLKTSTRSLSTQPLSVLQYSTIGNGTPTLENTTSFQWLCMYRHDARQIYKWKVGTTSCLTSLEEWLCSTKSVVRLTYLAKALGTCSSL